MRGSPSILQAIQTIGRPVFSTREIAAVRGGSVSATSQALKRMAQQRLITSVARGLWCVPSDPRFTPFALVPYVARGHQAYVSFVSALHLHGLIAQIPQVVYAATTGHTRTSRTPVGTFSFHRIHPSFFAGFEWYRGGQDFLIATPEKALVDCLYMSSRKGRRFAFFPEIGFDRRFSFKMAAQWIERIPYERIRAHAASRLGALRRRSAQHMQRAART